MITLTDDEFYSVDDLELILQLIETKKEKTQKQVNYYNLICAFDIETTSFTVDDDNIFADENLFNYLNGCKIKVSSIENIIEYKHLLFPYITISKTSGIPLDEFYDDLITNYGFKPTIEPAEQLTSIVQALNENKPKQDTKQKCSIMYVWQFAINGYVFIGRTWNEFTTLIRKIIAYYDTNLKNRIIIYVHNLGMEFQYIRKLFDWHKVFAVNNRKPLFAITDDGIEFRCSYLLSGYSLAKVADNLQQYNIKKLVGDLDYTLPRHEKTPLTHEEISYCINDVLIVSAYIQECIINDGGITKIPYTATGYCRNYTRHQCLKAGGRKYRGKTFNKYHDMINHLRITDEAEYKQLLRAFAGGFTHASCLYSGITMYNVDSFDFTSAYPYVMLSEMFPMSTSILKEVNSIEEFNYYNKIYCTIFDITFYDLKPKFIDDNYISISKCVKHENAVINNGRVSSADMIAITLTNIDFSIIEKTYTWSNIKVNNFRCYRKGYLPKPFIKSIIKLYQDKTSLKGVEGKETEYMHAKALLNSLYGMCAQKPVTPLISYNDGYWGIEDFDFNKELGNYNKSMKRVTFYAWSAFVTAYARYNLWCGILEFSKSKKAQSDYIYCDTDSIKCINAEDHLDYINKYNALCDKKLRLMCKYHNIDYSELLPQTIKGETKPLGVWDWETEKSNYQAFKTLGAKRYIYKQDDKLHVTVAGVSKTYTSEYLTNTYGVDGAFDAFTEGLAIPADSTGKLTHYYIDDTIKGTLTDYMGNECKFIAPSGIYFEKAPYYFDISAVYIDFLKGIQMQK